MFLSLQILLQMPFSVVVTSTEHYWVTLAERRRDWAEKVYKADIVGNWEKLYKKPGYNPFKQQIENRTF